MYWIEKLEKPPDLRRCSILILVIAALSFDVCIAQVPKEENILPKIPTLEESAREEERAIRNAIGNPHFGYKDAFSVANRFKNRTIVPFLINLIEDEQEDSRTRDCALYILGATRDKRAIPVFQQFITRL